jgi:lambda family phage portal protein
MLDRIRSWFGGASPATVSKSRGLAKYDRGYVKFEDADRERHWEAADTTEENQHQWCNARGFNINEILVLHYETITQRATLEARRNSTVEGVIKSHAVDVVGDEGPGLVMRTEDDAWNSEAEAIFNEVACAVDGSGSLSLAEWLRQDIYQGWVAGDMVCQIVEDPDAKTVVKTRIHPINPNRLRSPYPGGTTERLILGVERSRLNRPEKYWFTDEIQNEMGFISANYTPVPARDIMHWFESIEPGQVRGFPWMASSLQTIADLRDYDGYVLDAAKVQAMMHAVMHSMSDNAEPEDAPADLRLKKMGITRAPVGWDLKFLQSQHPSSNNTDFRKERQRDLGRARGMPLMQIRLDSSGHNYSSARFDGQNYQKANRTIQGSLGRHRVYPLAELILVEAMQKGILRPRVFARSEVYFRWPQPPHVDPVKEAMAERIRLENKTMSPQQACAAHNLDFDKIASEWRLANDLLQKNGMPPMFGGLPTDLAKLATYLAGDEEPTNAEQSQTNETSAA